MENTETPLTNQEVLNYIKNTGLIYEYTKETIEKIQEIITIDKIKQLNLDADFQIQVLLCNILEDNDITDKKKLNLKLTELFNKEDTTKIENFIEKEFRKS